MEITLGNYTLAPPTPVDMRIAGLIWGDAGCGKTTLAATAPGKKLVIQFDPDGALSLMQRDDILVFDLSSEKHIQVIEKFKSDDPYGIEKMLKEHPELTTVIVDSMTTYAYLALQNAVANNKNSTMEQPGMHGYTWRNAVVLRCATTLMQLTKRLNRHIIYTTHEAAPDRNEKGVIESVTMALSEGTANQVGLRLNEVWWMNDSGKDHTIAVRPCRLHKPMKTRMFNATSPEFVWKFDPNTMKGDGIGTWFEAWKASGGRKISLPK